MPRKGKPDIPCTIESPRKAGNASSTEADVHTTHFVRERPLRYPPLNRKSDSFRLLELLPKQPGEPIRCELYTASVREHQNRYTALSYTWGAPNVSHEILVNGHRFCIRENLRDFFLSCLARNDFPILWIDAICINQADVAERNHQVGLMGKIYQGAKEVYAWLGSGNTASDWYLGYFSRYSAAAMVRYLDRRPSTTRQQCRFEEGRDWIRSRPNWSRIWVVQEILLAKKITVICGKKAVSWDSLDELEGRLDTEEWPSLAQPSSTGFNAFQRWRMSRSGYGFEKLLRDYGEMQCELAHDRVYALLGLADLGPGVSLDIDYSAPVEKVLCDILSLLKLEAPVAFTQYLARILELPPHCFDNTISAPIPTKIRLPETNKVWLSDTYVLYRLATLLGHEEMQEYAAAVGMPQDKEGALRSSEAVLGEMCYNHTAEYSFAPLTRDAFHENWLPGSVTAEMIKCTIGPASQDLILQTDLRLLLCLKIY